MKKSLPKYVSKFTDRHGKVRYRFRRGRVTGYIRSPYGTAEFHRELAGFMEERAPAIGADRIIPGSVSDVIARYYSDQAFMDLRPSTQRVFRGVLERFRSTFGDDPIRQFGAKRIHKLMNAMREKPHAAARLRKLLRQLFIISRRERIVPATFDPVADTKPPKPKNDGGYHRWTEAELAQYEARWPLGTKQRLAFALLLYGAQRSGDVRFLSHRAIEDGRIRLKQSKTANAVSVKIVAPLREAIDAGPTGNILLLETKDGKAFTAKGFYNLVKRACIEAELPHCSAHGLRKAAARRLKQAKCTNEEGMAITGHRTVREFLRYAGEEADEAKSDTAMEKTYGEKLSNPS